MTAFSNYLEDAILNLTLRGVAYTVPTTVYISLHTADPTDANLTATELSGSNPAGGATAYARVGVATSGWTAPSNGSSTNVADITFPAAGSNWGALTHTAVYSALTGGNLLYHGPLAVQKTINTGDVMRFSAGNYTVTLQ